MFYPTIYASVKVCERNPKANGRYFVVTDNEFQDGNVFLDGWVGDSELGKTTEWLEPLENRYIFTKEELEKRDIENNQRGWDALQSLIDKKKSQQ